MTTEEVKYPKQKPGVRFLCGIFIRMVSNYQVVGRENIPWDKQVLMTVNHLSYFDVVAFVPPLRHLNLPGFTAKKYQGTWREFFFNLGSPVWIDQESPDRKALMTALKLIEQGYSFGVAPEGHRSKTGGLQQGQDGAAFMANRANLPIWPIAVSGTEQVLKKARPTVRVVFGKPYSLPNEGRARGDKLTEYTERMMCAIAALLPERYHGHYAGNPLIEEMARLVRPDAF